MLRQFWLAGERGDTIASMEAVDRNTEGELEKAREIIASIDLPPEITGIDVRSGPDLYGDPALWMNLSPTVTSSHG